MKTGDRSAINRIRSTKIGEDGPLGDRPLRSIPRWTLLKGAPLVAVPLVFVVLFFFYPMGSILAGGITDDTGRLSLSRLISMISDPYYLRIIGFTLEQAFLSTVLSLILALPGAYLMARTRFFGKRLVRSLTTVPFVLPSILVVLGFVRLFGNNGLLNRILMDLFSLEEPPFKILYSLKAILLAHAFYNFPIGIRIIGSVWGRINPRTEDAARSLGAGGFRLFGRISLPQILPGILASAALIFVFCFMSFAIILVLGGGPRFSTLEVEVYRQAKVSLDLGSASSLAIIGSCITLFLLYVYIKLQQKTGFSESPGDTGEGKPLSLLLKGAGAFLLVPYLLIILTVIVAPMLAVMHYSFTQRQGWAGEITYTFRWYRQILVGGGERSVVPYTRALLNSLFYGIMTVAFSLPIGTALAHMTTRRKFLGRHVSETLLMLPLGVSAVILGLGYLRAFRRFPFPVHGRWYAIVLVHTVIATPFVIRAVSAVMKKIHPNVLEAARSLGAGGWRLFRHIELPLLKPGLITAAAFAFALSMGEVTATLMLTRADLITLPIAIYRLIGSYQFQAACAMGTVVMLVSLAAFFVIDRLGEEVW